MTPTELMYPEPPRSEDPRAVPTFEECAEEYQRYFDDSKAGLVSHQGIPEGHHVAYYGGKIHGDDKDPLALRARVATKLGVHPARIVVHYPWWW